jgi:hypothetical protein
MKAIFVRSKILVFFLFCLCFNSVSLAQTIFTNAQVYDFNVGDKILSRYQASGLFGPSGPPSYLTETYLSKSWSSNSDTIIYSLLSETYVPPACPNCTATYYSGISTKRITDLALPAEHGNQTTCFAIADTNYNDYCNKFIWEKHPVIDTGCFEPLLHTTRMVMGLGGPYFQKTDVMGPLFTERRLVAYRKNQDSCGVLLATMDQEKKESNAFKVFPNPCESMLHLLNFTMGDYYDIIDNQGCLIKCGKISSDEIDVINLPKGLYYLQTYSNRGIIAFTQFIKQ